MEPRAYTRFIVQNISMLFNYLVDNEADTRRLGIALCRDNAAKVANAALKVTRTCLWLSLSAKSGKG